jgi:hypothetical protein
MVIKPRVVYRWDRHPIGSKPFRMWQLTTEEQHHVKDAIRKLRAAYGRKRVCELMGIGMRTLRHSTETKHRISAGMALRVARVAFCPVDNILAGRWNGPAACPLCGRR